MSGENRRNDEVLLELLKVTSRSNITCGQGMEIAIRLFVSIALEAAKSNPQEAARHLEIAMAAALKQLRDPTLEIRHVVTNGETIN